MFYPKEYNRKGKSELIEENLDLVKKTAFYYRGRVGKIVEIDDLIQLGMVGLVEAAHNYSEQDNIPFVAYAKLRIKGSIVDYLRKSSNLCRGTIKRQLSPLSDDEKSLVGIGLNNPPHVYTSRGM